MKRPLIERKDFQPSIKQGEQAQGGVIGNLPRGVVSCVCFLEEKGENEFVRNFLFLCVEKFIHGKKCVQTKTMKGSYVYQVVVVEFMEGFP
jgi:hypothetical protein